MTTKHAEITTAHLHRFAKGTPLCKPPQRFTCPFHYVPHPLCIAAATELQNYLAAQTAWQTELQQGKMFGVLVVKDQFGELSFLAAFSGLLAEQNNWPHFVPPVYDLLQPGEYFKEEEKRISAINCNIAQREQDAELKKLYSELAQQTAQAEQTLENLKANMQAAKARREQRRLQSITAEETEMLTRESQFQKAELKRTRQRLQTELDALKSQLKQKEEEICALKAERKKRSAALQQWLFEQFRMLNANGNSKDLYEIFQAEGQKTPPAGAGECAAPKLLQYAYLHRLTPLCMAEFWWGNSPKQEIRHHGHYYPACKSKCEPILKFMLQGLETDPNPLLDDPHRQTELKIVYEDEWLLVVNKPAGMLAVPGKNGNDSVLERLRKHYPQATGPLLVHRLDMDTSGLLLAAKTPEVHRALQQQFYHRVIKKRYTALVEGKVNRQEGDIELPLCPNWNDRPRQIVDYAHGKPALTHYKVIDNTTEHTLLSLFPITGRTHQLRVHAAHRQGLNHPIVGDRLYGKPAKRLFLHAASLSFRHPVSGKELTVTCEAEWTDKE